MSGSWLLHSFSIVKLVTSKRQKAKENLTGEKVGNLFADYFLLFALLSQILHLTGRRDITITYYSTNVSKLKALSL